MKTLRPYLSLLIISFLSLSSSAQVKKGTMLVGGSIALSHSTYKYKVPDGAVSSGDQNYFTFNISPDISYFFIDRLSIGAAIPLEYSKSSDDYQTSRYTAYAIGPVVRYYFPFKKMAVFPELSYLFGGYISRGPDYSPITGGIEESKITGKTNTLKTGMGLTYFLNSSVGLEGVLFYQNDKAASADGYPEQYNSASISFNIGLQVYLGKNSD